MKKLFKCPDCSQTSTSKEWNEATLKQVLDFDPEANPDNMVLVEDDDDDGWFVCPKCKGELVGDEVEEVRIPPSTNKEAALTLLKKEE